MVLSLVLGLATLSAATPHNELNGLMPPAGAWRGTTRMSDELFKAPIHVWRVFASNGFNKTFPEEQLDFIRKGGILLLSLQPHNWAAEAGGESDEKIAEYAAAIKSVAPAQVMVAVGFEPNGHSSDAHSKHDVYGNNADYRRMSVHYKDYFAARNVTNVVWVMDYSDAAFKQNKSLVDDLWPGDHIGWLFFNMFQDFPEKKASKGNCSTKIDDLYRQFSDGGKYDHIPWGLGAWGTRKDTYGGGQISTSDRVECLNQVEAIFNGDTAVYPRLKAAVYFNSLECALDPQSDPPTLVSAFQDLQQSRKFTQNDPSAIIFT